MVDMEMAPPVQSPRRWNWPMLVAIVVVLVAGIVTAIVLVLGSGDNAKAPLVDPEVLVAARQEATNFFSLDYRTADADFDRVLALATGTFKNEYAAKRTQVISQLTSKKLVTTASIPQDGAAVEFVHGNDAQVLVVIDVSRTNAGKSDSLSNRARVLLTKVDGHWLVSGVNQVG